MLVSLAKSKQNWVNPQPFCEAIRHTLSRRRLKNCESSPWDNSQDNNVGLSLHAHIKVCFFLMKWEWFSVINQATSIYIVYQPVNSNPVAGTGGVLLYNSACLLIWMNLHFKVNAVREFQLRQINSQNRNLWHGSEVYYSPFSINIYPWYSKSLGFLSVYIISIFLPPLEVFTFVFTSTRSGLLVHLTCPFLTAELLLTEGCMNLPSHEPREL